MTRPQQGLQHHKDHLATLNFSQIWFLYVPVCVFAVKKLKSILPQFHSTVKTLRSYLEITNILDVSNVRSPPEKLWIILQEKSGQESSLIPAIFKTRNLNT